MCINTKKSCCIRRPIGPRCDVKCASILTMKGHNLPWVSEIRYFGTYIIKGRQFRCSVTNAKRSFNRSTNATFGKVGRLTSEEVTLQLVNSKCLFILLYGLECYSLVSAQDWSTFPWLCGHEISMQLFRTANKDIVDECRSFCNFPLPTEMLEIKSNKFCKKFKCNKIMLRYFNIFFLSFLFGVACQRWGLPHRLAQCTTPGKGLV